MTRGPTVACYYGLKIIKDLGLPVSKRVRFVVGTDEESGWGDMDYYSNTLDFLIQTLVSLQMPNSQSSTEKKETLPSTSISVVKTQVKRIFIASPVAFVKTWYLSQQLQSFQVI